MIKQKNIVYGLDSLRFILAFIVLLSHYPNSLGDFLKDQHSTILHSAGLLLKVSFCGVGSVIAFFIISGFVIHLPYTKSFSNPKKYFIRRYTRIMIPLIVITIISLKLDCFGSIPIWSLYCELIYYTIYPLMYKLIKGKWNILVIGTFILSYIVIFLFTQSDQACFLNHKNINYDGAYWQLGTMATSLIGLPCWLLGVLLADNLSKIIDYKQVSFLRITFFRVAIFSISVLLVNLKFHYFVSYIFTMNLFAIPLYYWIKNEIFYYKVHQPVTFLEFLGKFSYSIYLCHGVLLFIFVKFITVTISNYFIILALGVLFSYLYFLTVEKPSHKLAVKLSNKF